MKMIRHTFWFQYCQYSTLNKQHMANLRHPHAHVIYSKWSQDQTCPRHFNSSWALGWLGSGYQEVSMCLRSVSTLEWPTSLRSLRSCSRLWWLPRVHSELHYGCCFFLDLLVVCASWHDTHIFCPSGCQDLKSHLISWSEQILLVKGANVDEDCTQLSWHKNAICRMLIWQWHLLKFTDI